MNATQKLLLWKILHGLIFSLLLLQVSADTSPPRAYPRKLHERIMAKLNQRRGSLSHHRIGTWGSWNSWSACSRSCGTGVTTQSRDCKMPKVRKRIHSIDVRKENRCVGRYKRFQLCKTQECPGGLTDFRLEQCAAFDRTPFNRRYYSWEPFIESPDSCTLNCRAVGLGFYATLNQSVIDGTPCGGFSPKLLPLRSVCVAGKCMEVGCDGLLGSGRVVDACGVCGGDNATCRLISGVYARTNLPFGYNLIATLPPGATNLSIFHLKPSANYLALREVGGDYILNGPWGLNLSGDFETSGTIFTYSRPHAHGGDHLYGRGPTTHSLDIMLFYQTPDPGIKYEYRLSTPSDESPHRTKIEEPQTFPARRLGLGDHQFHRESGIVNDAISIQSFSTPKKASSKYYEGKRDKEKDQKVNYKVKIRKYKEQKQKKKRKRYAWIASGFTPCSQTCGGGIQTTRLICAKRKRKEVEGPAYLCAGLTPPKEESVPCNLRPCPAEWESKSWGPCSVTCGVGVQVRTPSCKQRVSPELTIDVPHSECKAAKEISTAQVCRLQDCNGEATWNTQPWSQCSSQCGIGVRRRNVTCTSIKGPVDDYLCKELKPLEEEMCDMGSCASDTWFFSAWEGTCRGPCGEGTEKRRVHCSGDALEGKESSSCSANSKPPDTRKCHDEKVCGGSWFTGPWSECDTWCGSGSQRRAVVCVMWHRGRYRVARSVAACKFAGERPVDLRACVVDCRAKWFTSEWSECSASCNNGVQRREVKCLDQDLKPSLDCSSATKPDSRQACNRHPCKSEKQNDERLFGYLDDKRLKGPSNSSSLGSERPNSSDKSKEYKFFQSSPKEACIDRMKNCHLVYKARLCKLKYYNKLCCETCLNY